MAGVCIIPVNEDNEIQKSKQRHRSHTAGSHRSNSDPTPTEYSLIYYLKLLPKESISTGPLDVWKRILQNKAGLGEKGLMHQAMKFVLNLMSNGVPLKALEHRNDRIGVRC